MVYGASVFAFRFSEVHPGPLPGQRVGLLLDLFKLDRLRLSRRAHDLVVEAVDVWLNAVIPAVPLDIVRAIELRLCRLRLTTVNNRSV
jgi:hypothetical protein